MFPMRGEQYQGHGVGSILSKEVDWGSAVVGGDCDEASREASSECNSTMRHSARYIAKDVSRQHGNCVRCQDNFAVVMGKVHPELGCGAGTPPMGVGALTALRRQLCRALIVKTLAGNFFMTSTALAIGSHKSLQTYQPSQLS